jgi:capsular exopolysaccharide synthesis family protein
MPTPKRPRTLLDDFSTEAPHVTEVRRMLQTLQREYRGTDRKVFMFTSASRGEGKSTTCALVALVAARIFHRRTLVIDTDMRRPTAHTLLGVSHSPGLFDYMVHDASSAAVRHPTMVPSLQLIPAGHPTARVSESFEEAKFARLLSELRGSYDFIFVDTAPVIPVIEPIMIAEHVDGIILVASAGVTPIPLIRRMVGILEPVRSKIVGGILCNAAEGLPYFYDYAYYGYKPNSVRRRARQPESSPIEPDASEDTSRHDPAVGG